MDVLSAVETATLTALVLLGFIALASFLRRSGPRWRLVRFGLFLERVPMRDDNSDGKDGGQ